MSVPSSLLQKGGNDNRGEFSLGETRLVLCVRHTVCSTHATKNQDLPHTRRDNRRKKYNKTKIKQLAAGEGKERRDHEGKETTYYLLSTDPKTTAAAKSKNVSLGCHPATEHALEKTQPRTRGNVPKLPKRLLVWGSRVETRRKTLQGAHKEEVGGGTLNRATETGAGGSEIPTWNEDSADFSIANV